MPKSCVAIRNQGTPIPPGELTKIFDPLVRGASAQQQKQNRPGSIGLGLYIARELITAHGGTIGVTSSAEAGTVFTFHLPKHVRGRLPETRPGASLHPPESICSFLAFPRFSLRGTVAPVFGVQFLTGDCVILIVDDQKDTGTGLERLLRYAGHEAISVTGGAEALTMLHIRKPALLVLDVNMPEMDGLTVLKTIKEHDELKDVRVAMYSSDTQPKTMMEAKRLGAVDFLVKGTVGFDKVVARIAELAGEPPIAQ